MQIDRLLDTLEKELGHDYQNARRFMGTRIVEEWLLEHGIVHEETDSLASESVSPIKPLYEHAEIRAATAEEAAQIDQQPLTLNEVESTNGN